MCANFDIRTLSQLILLLVRLVHCNRLSFESVEVVFICTSFASSTKDSLRTDDGICAQRNLRQGRIRLPSPAYPFSEVGNLWQDERSLRITCSNPRSDRYPSTRSRDTMTQGDPFRSIQSRRRMEEGLRSLLVPYIAINYVCGTRI